MRGWKTKVMSFDRGLDTTDAVNVGGPHFEGLSNVQFGRRGELRTRPGISTATGGFSKRGLDANGFPTDTTLANFAATGYSSPAMNAVRVRDEIPLLTTRGRAFTYESTDAGAAVNSRWSDRGGVLQARWDYVGTLRQVEQAPATNAFTSAFDFGVATGYDFGPAQAGVTAGMTSGVLTRLSDGGVSETSVSLPGLGLFMDWNTGNGATLTRVGAVSSLIVFVQQGTNNLVMAGHVPGSSAFSATVIATDAAQVINAPPVLFADYDATNWFIAYWTTTTRVFKVIKVTTGFVVSATYTSAAVGAGNPSGLWATNSSVADDRVVVAAATTGAAGFLTRVLNHALVDQAIDVTLTPGTGQESVVLGAAEGGSVWGAVAFTAAGAGNSGLRIFKRSTSAATSTTYSTWFGESWGVAIGGFSNSNSRPHHLIYHQPIKVGGRVLIGLGATSPTQGTGPGGGLGQPFYAAHWYVMDITDLNAFGSTTGTLRDPVMVARSELDVVVPFRGPRAAMRDQLDPNHYRFPVQTWDDVVPVMSGSNVVYYGSAGAHNGVGQFTHRLVDVVVEHQQVGHHRNGTIIAGAVPRVITSGDVLPVGFPWQGAPGLTVTPAPGADAYTLVAVWTHLDEAGVLHRSEPSEAVNVTSAAFPMAIVVTNPQFNERPNGTVVAEIYCTTANPSANAPRYLALRVPAVSAAGSSNAAALTGSVTGVSASSTPLYTDGNVMAVRHPAADGGVAAVGDRTWISDGKSVFASRLGPDSGVPPEAPSWNDDGPLRLELPAAAGRVVALSDLEDKLLILCTGGVWAVAGEGPDDTGQGTQYRQPVRVLDVGTDSPRSVVSTSRGTFFLARNTRADGSNETGGIWLVDRSLSGVHVSRPLDGTPLDLSRVVEGAYLPQREIVMFIDTEGAVRVLDLRENKWAAWSRAGDFPLSAAAVGGLLWGVGTGDPFKFDRSSGDDTVGGSTPIAVGLTTSMVAISSDQSRRGRLRSITPMVRSTSEVTFVDVAVTLDDATGMNASNVTFTPGDAFGNSGPQFPLTIRQKGRVAQVDLSVSGGDPLELTGIVFEYKDDDGRPNTARTKME